MAPRNDDPVVVTSAGISPREERRSRERRYLITMAVRVVAIIVAVVISTWWIRVIVVALALVLPWVGVVMANAPIRHAQKKPPAPFIADRQHELL